MELHRHPHVGDLGVLAVAQGEVDQPVDPTEGDRGLGAVLGEQLQPATGTAGEHEDEDPGKGHDSALPHPRDADPSQHDRDMGRAVLVGAGVVVLVLALLTGLLWAVQRSLIFLPDPGPVPAASTLLDGARDVVLTTADGLDLGGWYLPGDDGAAAVLVANGNAGNRG